MINSDASVSPVAGSPFSENLGTPSIIQIVPDPKGRFLYVLNVSASAAGGVIGRAGIGGFGINSVTGALTPAPGSPLVFSSDNSNLMAIDGTGQFLFEPNGLVGSPGTGFNVYAIDQSTGALTLTSAISNASPIGSFTLASADGRFVFNAGNGLVEVFSISVPTGQLLVVPGTPTSTFGSAGPMAASRDGKFLYVANQAQGTVAVFSISATGALTLVSGSPFPIDIGAQFLTLTPNGAFLYVAATPNGGATIKGYTVNPSTGTFAPIAGAALSNFTTVTMDASGSFVYISRIGQLSTFTIDPVTGALTQVKQMTAPSSDDPNNVVAVP